MADMTEIATPVDEVEMSISTSKQWGWKVFIQGNPETVNKTIITFHDIGCNHTMWHSFVDHPMMSEIRKRAVWVHVELPGQGDHEDSLADGYKFPSLQEMGEEVKAIVDHLQIKHFVGLGEGAGANILARYAMTGDQRVLGVCLIHCTGTTAGLMESIKDKLITYRLSSGMNATAEGYLVLHRFGNLEKVRTTEELEQTIETFCHRLYNKINPRNLMLLLNSFLERTNINLQMQKLTCPVLVVTGTKASFNHTVQHLYEALLHSRTTPELRRSVEYVPIGDVANVLSERPDKMAECLQYFLQGLGYVASVRLVNVPPSSVGLAGRTLSMEEADKPRRGSFTGN